MGLLHKVRILMGALVHKPFSPRPEKADLGHDDQCKLETEAKHPGVGMEPEWIAALEDDRVADLIAQRDEKKEG